MPEVDLNPKEPKFKRPDLLLHPQIPPSLHGINPRTILGQEWWDDIRKQAYAENNYCCWACGRHTTEGGYLAGHEAYRYDYERLTATLEEVVALCERCHLAVHTGYAYMTGRFNETVNYVRDNFDKDFLAKWLDKDDKMYIHARAPWKLIVDEDTIRVPVRSDRSGG